MARSVVGVTVHDDMLRGVEIGRDQPRRWGEVALAAGVIDQGTVVDVEALAASLTELWKSAGFSSKRIALAIETEAATIRRVTLPGAVVDDIAEAAMYDIAELLPYPAGEAVIDHAVLNADAVTAQIDRSDRSVEDRHDLPPIEALVVAVRRETIEAFTAAAKLAGLRWVRAELAPAANLALLPERLVGSGVEPRPMPPEDATGADGIGQDPASPMSTLGAVVAIGETTTTVAVHDGGGLLFARVLMTGVGDFASLSHELESQLAEVEQLRTGGHGTQGNETMPNSDAPGVGVVAEGIRRTLLFHMTDIDKRVIDHVALCGSSSRASGLIERVVEAMPDASVTLIEHDDWPSIDQPERFDTAFAVARLVQTSHTDHLRDLCLVPAAVIERRQDRRAAIVGAAAAAVVGVVAFGSFESRSTAIDQRELTVEAAETAVARVRDEVAQFGDERSLAAEIDRRQRVVTTLAADRVAVPSLVGQLAEAMPADSVLRSLQITTVVEDGASRPVVNIAGAAPDLDGVAGWIDGVEDSGVLTDIRLIGTSFGAFGVDEQNAAVFQVSARVAGNVIVPLPPTATEKLE